MPLDTLTGRKWNPQKGGGGGVGEGDYIYIYIYMYMWGYVYRKGSALSRVGVWAADGIDTLKMDSKHLTLSMFLEGTVTRQCA